MRISTIVATMLLDNKVVEGHPKYIVTPTGLIYSNIEGKLKLLKQYNVTKDYKAVSISKGRTNITKKVHRLVGTHFIPNPNNFKELNHIKGDKTSNAIGSLEWTTCSNNINHAYKVLNRPPSLGNLRITKVIFLKMLSLHNEGYSYCKIAKLTGYSDTQVGRIIKNKNHYKQLTYEN